ncbi:hypothetical protein VP1G_09698 [Cytospora mali]|uniref:Uncharacterized protein n=1 Tax=Cytospora mali TaxID=578113 RepID=A0A194VF02_CYTMA|nr:hypothetical protein VP1G_09698 [Valsa mali var. pyri (nom. inval.)]
MVSKKNKDIRSFFSNSQASKPPASRIRISQTPTPAPEPSLQSNNGGPYSQSPSPPPEVPSSPPNITSHDPDPDPTPRAPLSCDAVIAASDDEEDPDSDDDLFPDLGFIGGPRNAAPRVHPAPRNPPAPARRNPCVTPRAKRTATAPDFLSSPLTIQSKKKKYDMKSLLEFTRKDDETRASAQRFSALLEEEAEMQRGDGGFVDEEKEESSAAAALKEHILESAVADGEDEGNEEGGGPDRMRIVRALERTELGGDTRRYYFFEHNEPEVHFLGRKFPKDKAKGAWAVLGGAQDRARHFASGFPYNIQKKLGNMPDEIFLWVLDEVCSEQRIPLQVEYRKLLSICHDQTQRLVTPTLLQQLFRNIGATKDVSELMVPITLREETSNPYPNRNWSCVENFLALLGHMSDHFTSATRSTAMQILLRLGMDNIAVESFGYAQKWREAADLIAHSVPDEQWISFCQEICSSLSESTQKATMRWRAIALLGPAVTPGPNTFSIHLQTRTLDLKRRLASVFFFDDLQRADKKPEDTVHIRAIIDRLEDDEFQINQNTDYQELGALMMMLNVALGDASKKIEMTETSITSFDAEVDELAEGLKSMLTRVAPLNKGIHVSRIEAKNAMELIRERLLYQVRIKSVPKVGIFGKREEEDSSVPRQRDFMKGFLLKKKREASVRAESNVVKTEPAIKVEVDAIMAG